MPSRRRRYRTRRYRPRRRGYRTRRRRSYRSKRYRSKGLYAKTRDTRIRVSLRDLGSVQQVPAAGQLILAGATSLGALLEYTSYTAIFRYYKINRITVYFRNDTSPADTGGTIAGQVNLTTGAVALTSSIRHRTTLGWCKQVAYGTNYTQRMQFESAVGFKEINFFPSNKPWFKIGCRPKVIKELTEGATTSAEVPTKANFFIPCTQHNVPHYGYQFLFTNNDPVDALNVSVCTICDITFYGKKSSTAPN